ncbi:MAG: putative phage tail protein [Cellulosilyticaceae bacterium]
MNYGTSGYGQDLYGSIRDPSSKEDEKINLMKYLPHFYQTVEQITTLQDILGIEVDGLLTTKDEVIKQLYVETATWGLDRWEKLFDLETDINKSFVFRRERIKAKIRGVGTTTKQMIVNVASAFSNGEVEVIEDNKNYRFVVKFIGVKGVPANMLDLTRAIEDIKPAHLAFCFEYTYNYWDTLKSKTWGETSAYTWKKLKVI